MKASKVVVSIRMESLSIDTLAGILASVIEQVDGEAESGMLVMADGDQIEWATERTEVEF